MAIYAETSVIVPSLLCIDNTDNYEVEGQKNWNIIKDGVSYYNIRNNMKTFDMIFFRGAEGVSSLISYVEKKLYGEYAGKYTHVGLVIRGEDFPRGCYYYEPNKVYVFESTQSGNLGDGTKNIDFESKLGVQLRDLDRVAETYDANPNSIMAWGRLIESKRPLESEYRAKYILHTIRKYNGIKYDASFIDLLSALSPKLRWLRRLIKRIRPYGKDWQFCSEMNCNFLRDFNIIPKTINAEDVLPCDFLENPDNRGYTFDVDNMPLIYETPLVFTTRTVN